MIDLKYKPFALKKVLIITYYWPPAGGGGVQRWVKFVKYLRNFGWEPVIYTCENPSYPVTDPSLSKDIPPGIEVIKTPIWEPYDLYRKFTGRKKDENLSAAFTSGKSSNKFKENISNWIRSNFFIPDARRFWIKPSVKFLKEYLEKNKIDMVVTTGPPHSMHLIGLKLKKALSIKWIADFRDPWTSIDYYEELKLTRCADRLHHKMEKEVLLSADRVIVVSPHWAEEFKEIGVKKISVITNGYDEDDVLTPSQEKQGEKFSIAHLGVLMKHRNPWILWRVLSKMAAEDPDFKKDLLIKLIGNVDVEVVESVNKHGLSDNLYTSGYIPHEEILKIQQSSAILLLLINQIKSSLGMIPGKLFEYLAAQRPILVIGPENGDAASIVRETKSGVISEFGDEEGLEGNIKEYYARFKDDRLGVSALEIKKYSRKELTGDLCDVFEKMLGEQ